MIFTTTYSKAIIIAMISISIVVVGMIIYENSVSEVGAGLYLEDGKLSDAQKESIKITLDLLKTLMTWVIGVIGATAFFLKLNVEQTFSIRHTDLVISFVIIILSTISLYLGHLAVEKIAILLSLDQYPLDNEKVRQIGRLQYITGLSSVALFGFHVFQFFWARLGRPQE
jgi:hypothetical protein